MALPDPLLLQGEQLVVDGDLVGLGVARLRVLPHQLQQLPQLRHQRRQLRVHRVDLDTVTSISYTVSISTDLRHPEAAEVILPGEERLDVGLEAVDVGDEALLPHAVVPLALQTQQPVAVVGVLGGAHVDDVLVERHDLERRVGQGQVSTLRATHLVHVPLQAADELLVVDGVLVPHLGQSLPHPDMTSCLVIL